MIHPERFGELVARNRGADARVFTDEAAAREWAQGTRSRALILQCHMAGSVPCRSPDTLDSKGHRRGQG
jgi:hypothetical protein